MSGLNIGFLNLTKTRKICLLKLVINKFSFMIVEFCYHMCLFGIIQYVKISLNINSNIYFFHHQTKSAAVNALIFLVQIKDTFLRISFFPSCSTTHFCYIEQTCIPTVYSYISKSVFHVATITLFFPMSKIKAQQRGVELKSGWNNPVVNRVKDRKRRGAEYVMTFMSRWRVQEHRSFCCNSWSWTGNRIVLFSATSYTPSSFVLYIWGTWGLELPRRDRPASADTIWGRVALHSSSVLG